MKWWLGVSIYTQPKKMQFVCPEGACKEKMDNMGDHAVTCKFGPSRIVNKTWPLALKGAVTAVKMEVYTDPETMHRAADTLVDGWEFGRSAAHGWVVSHTLQAKRGKGEDLTLPWSGQKGERTPMRNGDAR